MKITERKGRKFTILLLLLFFSFILFTLLFFKTSLFINILGSILERSFGYRISAKSISFSPRLSGDISGLEIIKVKDDLSLSVSHVKVKSGIRKSFKGEIEEIILTHPKFSYRFKQKKEKFDWSFFKKLPSVNLLAIRDGELEVSFTSHPQLINLSGVNLQINDFSPRRGGDAVFRGFFHTYSSVKDGIHGEGWCKGSLKLTGLFPKPSGNGTIELHFNSGSYRSSSLKNLIIKFPLTLDENKMNIDSALISLDLFTYKGEGRDISLSDLLLQASLSYDLKTHLLISSVEKGIISNLGSYKGVFQVNLTSDYPWKAFFTASPVDITEAYSFFKPFLPKDYQKWSVQGTGAVETHLEGNYPEKRLNWKGELVLSFRQGGFSSPDGLKAGQGIKGNVRIKLKSSNVPDKKIHFDVSSDLGDGELLWGKFYKDFSDREIALFSQGSFFLTLPLQLEFQSSLDFFETGQYSVSGLVQKDKYLFHIKVEKIDHHQMMSIFKDYLSDTFPLFRGFEIDGNSWIELETIIDKGRVFSEGVINLKDIFIKLPDFPLLIEQLEMALPFDIYYPSGSHIGDVAEKQPGFLKISTLKMDSVMLEDMKVPLILSQNIFLIPEDIELPLFGGKIRIKNFLGKEILTSSRQFSFGLNIDKIDMSLINQQLSGIIEADLPEVRYERGMLSVQGSALAKIFGGEAELEKFYMSEPFSRSRKIGGDIYFTNINLEKLTEKIKIGKITGVIFGYVKDMEIEYGQPSRFILDIESVKEKGIAQKISVDAIQNISILGTGSGGIARILNSGIRRFFKEYPYSRIGIRCLLENDRFSVRGKIHEGGTEYLVRRAFLRGIDVVNQNPQNEISFRDMQERVKRIFQDKEEN